MKLSAALWPALAAAVGCAAALTACASGDISSGLGNDAGSTHDAGAGADAGADAGTDAGTPTDAGTDAGACTASASYGVVAAADQQANFNPGDQDGGADDSYTYQGNLNADVDYIQLELYAGLGVFADGLAPGTYTIAGADLNYSTCGLCVLVFTNYNGTDTVDSYFATAGTVTISSLYPTFAGTFSNVAFQHVTIDDDNNFVSTPVNDGCVSTVTELDFSAADTTSSRSLHRQHR